MKPRDLLNYYKGTGLDIIHDQILQELIKRESSSVQDIVIECSSEGISSPATTYKKLEQLLARGLIEKEVCKEDTRCRLLTVTPKGEERIKYWGKK